MIPNESDLCIISSSWVQGGPATCFWPGEYEDSEVVAPIVYVTLCKTPSLQTGGRESPAGLKEEAARFWEGLWRGPWGNDWRVVSLGAESGYQPTAREETRTSLIKTQGNEFYNNHNKLGNGFFPSQTSRWECSPANILIAALWDPEELTRAMPRPELWLMKLWDHKSVLFWG